jgi:hypothetical protein
MENRKTRDTSESGMMGNKVKIYAPWLVLSWCLMVAHLPSQGMKMMSSDVWKLGRYSWGITRFMAEDPLSILKWWPLICQFIVCFSFNLNI